MITKFKDFKMNENEGVSNYMFIQNLKQITNHVNMMLEKDEQELDMILKDHAWAVDHIATSKDDIEEVCNFLCNYKK